MTSVEEWQAKPAALGCNLPNSSVAENTHLPRLLRDERWTFDTTGRMDTHESTPFLTEGSAAPVRRLDTFGYDARGFETRKTLDDGGFSLTSWSLRDDLGRVRAAVDPRGFDTLLDYNVLGWPIRELSRPVDPDGDGPLTAVRTRTDFYHDANGNVIREERENRDETGQLRPNASLTTRRWFDELNRLVREEVEVDEGHVLVTEHDVDPFGAVVETRTPLYMSGGDPFARTQWQFDERGLLYRETVAPDALGPIGQSGLVSPAKVVTQHDYDGNGNSVRTIVGVGTPEPRVTTRVYDGFDRLVEEHLPTGTWRKLHRDVLGAVTTELVYGSDGSSSATEITLSHRRQFEDVSGAVHDACDVLFDLATGAPLDGGVASTRTVFTPGSHSVEQVLDAHGNATLTFHDTAGRVAKTVDPLGNTTSFVHDENGIVVQATQVDLSQVDADGDGTLDVATYTSTSVPDTLGRIVRTEDSLGHVTRHAFDSSGNETRTVDALGRVTRRVFDGVGRLLLTARDPAPGREGLDACLETWSEWDDNTRLVAQRDDNGHQTDYLFDPAGRLLRTTFADGTKERIERDAFGDDVVLHHADGTRVDRVFDAGGRLVTEDVTPGPGGWPLDLHSERRHDGLGRLTWAADVDSELVREHDSAGRILRETVNGLAVETDFDRAGNVLSKTWPGGRSPGT